MCIEYNVGMFVLSMSGESKTETHKPHKQIFLYLNCKNKVDINVLHQQLTFF